MTARIDRSTLATLTLLVAAASASSQTLMREQQSLDGPSFTGVPWVAAVGDIDGDGVRDLAVTCAQVFLPEGKVPMLSLVSGADGSVLSEYSPGSVDDYAGYAQHVDSAGDQDGDGVPDVIVSRYGTGPGFPPGVDVLSGADPSVVLRSFDLAPGAGDLVLQVLGPGDLDGDGVPELAFSYTGCPISSGWSGRVEVYSGATATLLYGWCGDAKGDGLGSVLTSAGDADGDGVPDLLVGAPQPENYVQGEQGYARVFSGATGALLYEVQDDTVPPIPYDPAFARSAVGVGDVDGDGHDDIAVGVPAVIVDGDWLGAVRVFSGADGALLREILGPVHYGYFGQLVVAPGDLDGDGVQEVGARTWDIGDGGPGVLFYSLADGALLFSQESPNDFLYGTFNMATPGDLNGDGTPDFVISGALPEDQQGPATSVVRVHSGRRLLFPDLGGALAGAAGEPVLLGEGSLERELPLDLWASQAAPDRVAWLVVGLSPLSAPFKGGVLVPSPDLVLAGLTTDAEGAFELHTALPVDVPATFEFWIQAWFQDGTAPNGLSASNALLASKAAILAGG